MSGDGKFFEQFIEDYYAECDEHLVAARRLVLAMEAEPTAGSAQGKRMNELFRSLHTLKGLSGMVGLERAERVAHAMEDALRDAQRQQATLEGPLLDALFAGLDLLERCVSARRAGGDPPAVDRYLATLALLRRPEQTAASDEQPMPAAATEWSGDAPSSAAGPPEDAVVHHFEFVPSRELSARGIGVESIRTRLAGLGTLLDAKPRVVDGGIAFDFWVAVAPGKRPDPDWRDDGLLWSEVETDLSPAAAPSSERETAEAPVVGVGGGSHVVRVDLAKLDEVMRFVGELVTIRAHMDDLIDRMAGASRTAAWEPLHETSAIMERQLRGLREGVMRLRLVPVGEVFERLRFAVRDVAREAGKQVTLVTHGQETAIDKIVVDRMLEPLLHLVRNAVSHGLEAPSERRARGKPEEGRITLRAAAAGDRIVIDVEDDGAGIDLGRVESRARERGLIGESEPLADGDVLEVLCAPGLSTRDEADLTSGRGVGLDVVRATVRGLGGELAFDSRPGEGTRFSIDLPLTLMIVDALLVEVAGQQMAVPQPVLREVLRVERADITPLENNEVMSYRGGVLPILTLRRIFNLPESAAGPLHVLVVGSDAAPAGLLVERLAGLREIVVHPVSDPLVAMPGIAGATQLGDGRVSLVLDSAALVRMSREQGERRRVAGGRTIS